MGTQPVDRAPPSGSSPVLHAVLNLARYHRDHEKSAGLVHDNERCWRVFRARVVEIVGHEPAGATEA